MRLLSAILARWISSKIGIRVFYKPGEKYKETSMFNISQHIVRFLDMVRNNCYG